MRILQINAYCGYGSTGRIVMDIVNSLTPENDAYVMYGFFKSEYQNAIKILPGYGWFTVKRKILMPRITGISGFSRYSATKKAMKLIDQCKPDVIHLHNIHGEYIHCGVLFNYLKKNNIPVVWTLHDCWAFTGRCSYFDYAKCEKWKKGCFSCKNRKVYPITYLFDFSRMLWKRKKTTFQGVNNLTIVTPSNWLASKVKESFLGKYPITVIHNGVDTNAFVKQNDISSILNKYHLNNKKILLGVASAWSQRKGLSFFIELSHKLPEEYRIVLIGLSEKQIADLPHSIIGIKRTDSIQELAQWYSAATAFINPTLEDNYPTTNVEAQACGTPVITFRTGGSPESIQYGFITERKDSDSILDAINLLNSSESKTIDRSVYSREHSALQYISLYTDIIQKRRHECGLQ